MHDLIAWNPDDVEPEVNVERARLLGNDFADDLVPVAEPDLLGCRLEPSREQRSDSDPQSRHGDRQEPAHWAQFPSSLGGRQRIEARHDL